MTVLLQTQFILISFTVLLLFFGHYIFFSQKESVNTNLFKTIKFVYHQPTFSNDQINTTSFNYRGKCQEIFKFKPNNKRDVVISGGSYNFLKTQNRLGPIIQTLQINRSGVPNADIVVLLTNTKGVELFRESVKDLQIIIEELPSQLRSGALERFYSIRDYLKRNREKYDRVILGDLRDVMVFADGFATFGKNDLLLLEECYGEDLSFCQTFKNYENFEWMKNGFGFDVAQSYRENNTIVQNSGVMMGGIDKIIKMLDIFCDGMKPQEHPEWGYEQATFNYLFYTHAFDEIGFESAHCSQKICFLEGNTVVWDSRNKAVYSSITGCSPVVRHKITDSTKGLWMI